MQNNFNRLKKHLFFLILLMPTTGPPASAFLDSLSDAELEAKVQQLKTLYENERRVIELKELNHQKAREELLSTQKKSLIIGISMILLMIGFAIYLFFKQKKLKAQQNAFEAEQKLWRMQMNPHFLFNALSSIQSFLFDRSDASSAVSYLSKFASLMRQVLKYGQARFITIEEEIKMLDNYLSIQQLRFDHRFDYEIKVAPGINPREILLPPILAQPFVENAIEHAQVYMVENGKIEVSFSLKNEDLLLTVSDNGIGRMKLKNMLRPKKHQSLASNITQERIQMLSKLWKKPLSFNIIDLPQRGTQVIFKIPIISR